MLNPILKVFNFFPKKIKKNCLFFLVILLLISSLELLSVGLIIPVVKFFLNENFFLNLLNKYNFYFFNKDNFLDNKNFFYSLLILLFIFVILLKNLITIFFTKTKNLIAANIHVFLSNKLLLSYLEISFDKFILESKSILIKNIVDETNRLRYSFLLIITILSELFISLVILIFMFLLYPKIILPILILAIVSILFIYLFNKKQIYLLAKIRLKHQKIYINY